MGAAHRSCPFLLLVQLFFQFIFSVTSLKNFKFVATFDPPFKHDLVIEQEFEVHMNLTVKDQYPDSTPSLKLDLEIASLDDDITSVNSYDKQIDFRLDSEALSEPFYKGSFSVQGNFVGKTAVCIRLLVNDELLDTNDTANKEISNSCREVGGKPFGVWVIQRKGRIVNHIFLSALVLLIVIANVLMGCELDLKLVLETLKKPVPPFIGFCTQFIAMPLLAYCIATTFFLSKGLNSFALGLFVSGCAPGGGASNYWTLLLDGNVPVSITMTFISTLAALVMMPAWMWALGSHFLQGYDTEFHIKMPYAKIISSLFTMIVPLIIGIGLTRWKPSIRTKAQKVMRPFLIFVLVFLIGFGTIANLYMFRLMTWTALLGGLLLPWCGFTVGCFASLFTRQTPKVVTAIAIETGIQNTGIAIMLLKFSFPEPDSDISAVIPVISACFTPVPLLFIVGAHEMIIYVKKMRELNSPDAELAKKLNQGDTRITTFDVAVPGNQKAF